MPEQEAIPSVGESVDSGNQQPQVSEDAAALRAKLELVQRDNLSKGEANKALNERLGEAEKRFRELENQLKTATTKTLESSGEYKQLWQDASAENAKLMQRISELETALSDKDTAISAERLKATALRALSDANAVAPDQLYGLIAPNIRESDGQAVVIVNGIEQPIDSYLATLKSQGSGWDHHFLANQGRGMGVRASAPSSTSTSNPFSKDSFNLTEALLLEADNPDLAARLKAEAGV